jgi:hypothetical protein
MFTDTENIESGLIGELDLFEQKRGAAMHYWGRNRTVNRVGSCGPTAVSIRRAARICAHAPETRVLI